MGLRDLLRVPPKMARVAADDVTLRERLRDALKRPPQPNRYVAPRLRQLDALAFALRGYRVMWTTPALEPELSVPHTSVVTSSVLVYVAANPRATWNPNDCMAIELPTVVPGILHRAASWARNVIAVGPGFALWQARREFGLVVKAMRVGRRRR